MYKYRTLPSGKIDENYIVRVSDGASIPFDEANTDYQAYIKWLSEGNEPLPPDEGV